VNFPPVTSKARNHANFRRGVYGNRLRSWTLEEWRPGLIEGNVVLRYLGEGGGGPCLYDVRQGDVELEVDRLTLGGFERRRFTVNERAPDHRVVIQGEHLNEPGGSVRYTTVRAQMRDALREESLEVDEWRGFRLLTSPMTPSSREDYLALLERFPNHALEVSVYEGNLGDLPGRNAIVWEVRVY